jgi:alkylation response protein AidB-like acyl-CoA dehydrogenase
LPDDAAADAMRSSAYVARAHDLSPIIAEAAGRTEAGRRLDETVLAALHRHGMFRMLAPRWLGGGEAAPSEFVEAVEVLGRADASTAWCLGQMGVCAIAAVYLTPDAAREIFAEPHAAIAWGTTRDAKAVACNGGYRVSGTWEFASGCHDATWLGGHCPVVGADGAALQDEDGRPLDRTVLFPKSSAEITDVWRVLGLRGTGSDQYSLDGLFVPERHTVLTISRWPDADRLELAAPYRFTVNGLYAPAFAAVALGNARGMFEAFVDLAGRKTPMWRGKTLAHGANVQAAAAESDARLHAARVYLVDTLRRLEADAMIHGGLSIDQRMALRAASTFAIRDATRVAETLFAMAGTTAIFDGGEIERRFRDAHAISQHHQGRLAHLETVGKHLMGVESDLRFC